MSKVFISHSVEDLDIVSAISRHLKEEGFDVYVAEFRPEPGRYLADKILENIKSSDYFVAILTHAGDESAWVNQEIGVAKSLGKVVIPIVEKGVKVKGLLEGLEYIPLHRERPDATIRILVDSMIRLEKEGVTYTTGQVAKLLGLSFRTIKRWIYSGKITTKKSPSGCFCCLHLTARKMWKMLKLCRKSLFPPFLSLRIFGKARFGLLLLKGNRNALNLFNQKV